MTDYFKPSVTVDILIFSYTNQQLCLLLIQRKRAPFEDCWALPGGFIEPDETLDASARRELAEETGLEVEQLFFTNIYGNPGRDPRGRTISAAYRTAILQGERPSVKAQDDAKDARWFPISQLPELAFDHQVIIDDAVADLYAAQLNRYPAHRQSKTPTDRQDLDEALKHLYTYLQATGKLDAPA